MTDEELKKAVAEKVMEWVVKVRDYPRPGHDWLYDKDGNEIMPFYKWLQDWNANHWMMVVERMRELKWRCDLRFYPKDYLDISTADFYRNFTGNHFVESNESIGRAVFKAALKAVEKR